ncbi:MAG: TlpA family protein disulfide reductase [Planctomycetota bacterium]|jgi:thiol-disulfide isomerase/thioredoxin
MRTLALTVLILTVLAPVLLAEEGEKPEGPKAAWEAMQKAMMEARQAKDYATYRSIRQSRPAEFLDAWEKAGGKAEGEELYHLGLFYGMAKRHLDAMAAYRTCAKDEKLDAVWRERARGAFGNAVYGAVSSSAVKGEAALEAVAEMEAFAKEAEEPETKGSLLSRAGHCLSAVGRHDAAIARFLDAARASPSLAYGSARSAVGELMGGTWDMDAYDALRKRGTEIVTELTGLMEKHLAEVREGGDARMIGRAESSLERMGAMTKPLEMLGKPAPGWTLVKAYGETKAIEDRRGKVVMLDFWATWCGWCIKSFPAIRDVLEAYEGKDFAIVGVTAPANSVAESRYDLDDDLKAKGEGQPRPQYERFPAKGTPEEQAEFRVKEQEIIAKFIANHEMTWDVVMIDAGEPGPKYALTGWPHAMVLDKKGRVRYFKRGALLLDRPEAIEKLRKVIDSLLAE